MGTDSVADPGDRCSVARSLRVLGDRWILLILREAVAGRTRFTEFRSELGIARDVLAHRLAMLVEAGVLEKRSYQEPGSRTRVDYHLTAAGEEVKVILAALQQWGDAHFAHPDGPVVHRRSTRSGRPLRVAFVDAADEVVALQEADIAARLPGPREPVPVAPAR